MHMNNLKMDLVERFRQQIAKYFETDNLNLPELHPKLRVASEAVINEFERKEKGKRAYITVQ
jgi:hypothetical protein